MNLRLCFLLAVGLIGGQAADPAKKKDLDAMQGDWKLIWAERDGRKMEAEDGLAIIRTIKGNKVLSSKGVEVQTLEIDPSCDPKIFDLVLSVGENKGARAEGIYKIEGDKMVWCWYDGGGVKQRPLDFQAKLNSERIVIEWARIKR